MRKGSLKFLVGIAIAMMGTTVFAGSPSLSAVGVIVTSDEENNSTIDNNLFVFTAAFLFADLASDPDTPTADLKWSFFYDSTDSANLGNIEINGKPSLAVVADAANPAAANTINFEADGTTPKPEADFREVDLSPTAGSAPFPDPTAVSANSPDDVNLDGFDDRIVGELAVTFFVADDQNDINEVASASTIVYTIDTDPTGLDFPNFPPRFGPAGGPALFPGGLGDAFVEATGVPGLVFTPIDLNPVGGAFDPANIQDEWIFRNWTDQVGSDFTNSIHRWLLDSTSGTAGSPVNALSITGGTTNVAGTTDSAFDPDTSFGIWDNFADPAAEISAGNLFALRATMGWTTATGNTGSGEFDVSDAFRMFANAPVTGGFALTNNMSISGLSQVDLDANGTPEVNPSFPQDGETVQFLLYHNPLDGDFALQGTGDPTPFADIGMDFVNATENGNLLTATLSQMDIGVGAEGQFNANESQIAAFGGGTGEIGFDGTGDANFDGWGLIFRGQLFGGGGDVNDNPILADVASITATAGSMVVTTASNDTAANPSAVGFTEISHIAGGTFTGGPQDIAGDLNLVEVATNGTYRFDFTQSVTAGTDGKFIDKPGPVNQVGMPEPLNFRTRSVLSAVASAFADNSAQTIPLYHTWLEQVPAGTIQSPNPLVGAENDAQLVGGTLDFFGTDGTITYSSVRVNLLSATDPNVTY